MRKKQPVKRKEPAKSRRKKGGLTPKQKAFAIQYLVDHNATQAAIRAGYKAKNADVTGPRLLGNVGIQKFVGGATERLAEKVELTLGSHLRELERIKKLAEKKRQYHTTLAAEVSRGKAVRLYTEKVEFADIRQHPDAIRFMAAFRQALLLELSPEVAHRVTQRVDSLLLEPGEK